MLAELTQLNRRLNPAVAVLNEHAIAVFGGFYYEQQINNGIVFDTEQKTCKRILGGEEDVKFISQSLAQQVSNDQFITVGKAKDGNIHMVCLIASSNGSHYETRSIYDYGDIP